MSTNKPYHLTSAGDSPLRSLRGGRGTSRLLVGPENAGAANVDVHVNELEPGSGPGPFHLHELAENIYWVLEGSIEVRFPDETLVLGVDDVLFIPPGLAHATSNRGEGPARFLEIYAPAGDDFRLVDGPESG